MKAIDLTTSNVATVLVIIFALVGGVGTFVNPDALSFEDYVKFSLGAAAVLGIGRGLASRNR